jgi:hypothetical protein
MIYIYQQGPRSKTWDLLLPLVWDRRERAGAPGVVVAGDSGNEGHGWGQESEEEIEGIAYMCPPALETKGGGRISAAGGARVHHDNGGRLGHQSWQRSGASSDEEWEVAGTESEARDLRRGGSGAWDQTYRELERLWRLTRIVHVEKERAKGIRWGWPPNAHGNGKTERGRRGERNCVLTFDQGGMLAAEGLTGVGEESLESGKTTESSSDSRNRPHHAVQLNDRNSKVVSICTGSAQFRRKSSPESSPEFSRCRSSATVCGS